MNIPLMVTEHAGSSVDDLDRETQQLVDRLVRVTQQRAIIELHRRIQAAFDAALVAE